jgi:hypothetical protein
MVKRTSLNLQLELVAEAREVPPRSARPAPRHAYLVMKLANTSAWTNRQKRIAVSADFESRLEE